MSWTDGGVTSKYRWISASAGGTAFNFVYTWMNARYCPCFRVNLSGHGVLRISPLLLRHSE